MQLLDQPRIVLTLYVQDLISGMTLTNLAVRACSLADLDCARPATEHVRPTSDGTVRMPLALGFQGFLEITADDARPLLFVLPAAVSTELSLLVASEPIFLLSPSSVAAFEQSFQVPIAEGTSTVAVTILDCNANAAAGVRIQMAPPAVPFVVIAGLPVSRQDTTLEDGVGGFFNVGPGVALISATVAASGALIVQKALPVRSGWETRSTLLPPLVTAD